LRKQDYNELKQIIDSFKEKLLEFEDETNAETEWEEIHYALSNYNFDAGISFPRAIVSHPDCDKGTALMLFWRLSPDNYTQFDREDPESAPLFWREKFILLINLMNNYESGFYRNESICFNPSDDYGHNWLCELIKKKREWEIPPNMMKPTSGKQIMSELDEIEEMERREMGDLLE
jgi:hypothetical protein